MATNRDEILAEMHELRLCVLDGDYKGAKKRAARVSRMCDKLIAEKREWEFDKKVSEREIEASLSALTPNYQVGGNLVYYHLSEGQIITSERYPQWSEKEQN